MKSGRKPLLAGVSLLLCCAFLAFALFACSAFAPFWGIGIGMAIDEAASGELSQEETVQFVLDHREQLDAYMDAGDFSVLPEGLQEGVHRVSGDGSGTISIYCGGAGFGPSCQYWGFVYFPAAVPLVWHGHAVGDTGKLSFTHGGNDYRLEKICGRYYFYYEAY